MRKGWPRPRFEAASRSLNVLMKRRMRESVSARVLAAVVIASEVKSGNPRSQGLEMCSVKFVHQLSAAERSSGSVDNLEAHLAGGAGDDAKSGFVVACIQVFRLRLHDVHHLLACYFANLGLVRFFGTGSDVSRFL